MFGCVDANFGPPVTPTYQWSLKKLTLGTPGRLALLNISTMASMPEERLVPPLGELNAPTWAFRAAGSSFRSMTSDTLSLVGEDQLV